MGSLRNFLNEWVLSHVCGGMHHGRAFKTKLCLRVSRTCTCISRCVGMLAIGEWMFFIRWDTPTVSVDRCGLGWSLKAKSAYANIKMTWPQSLNDGDFYMFRCLCSVGFHILVVLINISGLLLGGLVSYSPVVSCNGLCVCARVCVRACACTCVCVSRGPNGVVTVAKVVCLGIVVSWQLPCLTHVPTLVIEWPVVELLILFCSEL